METTIDRKGTMAYTYEEKEERRKRITDLREQGMTIAEIAAALEISEQTVKKFLPPQRRLSPESQKLRDQVAELHKQGLKNTEIAERLGISRQRVGTLVGILPVVYKTEEPQRTFRISVDGLEFLREQAESFGLLTRGGPKIGIGDVHQLVAALQAGDLEIVRKKRK